MTQHETVIDHPSQLNALTTLPFFRTIPMGVLRLGGTLADHKNRRAWEAELNKHYSACGCTTSAKFLLLGVAVGVVWVALNWTEMGLGQAGLWVLGLAIAGGIVGKILGLAAANVRLQAVAGEIRKDWKVDTSAEPNGIACG